MFWDIVQVAAGAAVVIGVVCVVTGTGPVAAVGIIIGLMFP